MGRYKLVAKGSLQGLENGSDIPVLLVPEKYDTKARTNLIPIEVLVDPTSGEVMLWVNEDAG